MLGSCCHCVPLRGPDVPSRGATQEFLRRSSGSWKVPLTLIICAWQQERVRFASPEGFEVPSWSELAVGVRPPVRNIKDWEPGTYRGGRQHEAAARNPCTLIHRIVEHERVLFCSQSGPAAGTAFAVALSNPLVRVDSQLFRYFCSGACVSHCPQLRAHADVAVFLTLLPSSCIVSSCASFSTSSSVHIV